MPKITIKLPILICILFLLNITSGFSQTSKIELLELELQKKLPDTARLSVLRKMTNAYSAVDPEKMFVLAKRYKTLADKLKNDTVSIQATLDMGGSHALRSQMDSAMFYFSKGLERSKTLNYELGMARSFTNMGFVYDRISNPEKALMYYLQALPIYKKKGKHRGIAQCYINIGALYYDFPEFHLAENYFNQGLKAQILAKNDKGIASAYYSLGNTSKQLGAFEKANYYYTKSGAMCKQSGDINGIALAEMGLGKLENEIGNYDKALEHLELSLKLMRQIKNPYQECAVIMAIADSYVRKKEYKIAKEQIQHAMAISESINSKLGISICLKLLTEIAVKENKITEAFKYQTAQIAIDDTIQKEKVAKNLLMTDFNRIQSENTGLVKDNRLISEKNTDYLKTIIATSVLLFLVIGLLIMAYRANREKQATNKLLLQQKEEIASINEQLEMLNEDVTTQMELTAAQNIELAKLNGVKNKFFSIVSHDLRSPLATLKMLFSLYREGNLNEQEMKEVMERLEDATYSTSTFLDNLLEWSRSQLDGVVVQPSHFNLSDLIAENVRLVDSSIKIKQLNVKNNIDNPIAVFADPNMINIVVRNLLSNGVKFCRPGDSIVIDAKEADGKIQFSIADTGPGISQKDIEKLFQLEHTNSFGTLGEKGYHIGLILCKDMAEQNGGKIWVESELGKGTTFHVALPTA